MTRSKKQQNMPNNKNNEIKQIKELKVEYLSLKENMVIIICPQLSMKPL